tara:strand:+ start:601 stop:852 length:252 start_codon:yes stop_codon:yes gene_type:complete
MKKFDERNLEERLNILKEEDLTEKITWNKGIKTKLIILSPLILFLLVILFSKNYSSLHEIIISAVLSLCFILMGVLLYYSRIS